MSDENLDLPIWGGHAIAREAGLFNDDGTPDTRKAFYLLEQGHLPASKVGNQWVSTRRRLRAVFAGAAA